MIISMWCKFHATLLLGNADSGADATVEVVVRQAPPPPSPDPATFG